MLRDTANDHYQLYKAELLDNTYDIEITIAIILDIQQHMRVDMQTTRTLNRNPIHPDYHHHYTRSSNTRHHTYQPLHTKYPARNHTP